MKKSQIVEREFGVPFAGKILESSQWAKTALKKLPAEGPLDLAALFGRSVPLVVDLGCGNGRHLLSSAVARPEYDHIGIDILPMVLRYATRRANQRGLHNIRLAAIDAQTFVGKYLSPHSVREIHCYHPQPYHDHREAQKRLLTPIFLAQVVSVLQPIGSFYLQTDNNPYWEYLTSILPNFFEFTEQKGPWPDAPQGRTRREIMAIKRRYRMYRGWGTVHTDLAADAAAELAQSLPLPTFDA
jgi:tRNA (guanine-N7-)-methyltransferase